MTHFLIALGLLLSACSAAGRAPKPSSGLSKDDAVFEAVFLHEIAADNPGADQSICIAVRGATNDGAALFGAIQARHPSAVRDVECSGGGPTDPVTLTATGGKAVRFDVGPIVWIDDTSAFVNGGGGHRGGGAIEIQYRVEKSGSGWKVVDEKVMLQT